MSGVLDQILLEDIQSNCPEFFLNFHKCMSQNPNDCAKEQYELSNCIKQKVPSIQKIQKDCKAKMSGYENCLRSTGKVSACTKELEELRACATSTL